MNELDDLLDALAALGANPTPEQVAEVCAGITDPDTVATLLEQVAAASAAIADGGTFDDDTLAQIDALEVAGAFLAERSNTLAAEAALAEQAATEAQERAQALADAIRAGGDEGDPEPGDEGDPANPEAEADPVVPDEVLEPVAASAGVPARRPVIGRMAARRPASMQPPAAPVGLPAEIADWGLVASANAPNVQAGTAITTREGLSEAFLSAWSASNGYRNGPRVKLSVARTGDENPANLYGEDRFLDRNAGANHRKIEAAVGVRSITAAGGFQTITAAGGICAPREVRYDLPVLGTDERPVRDSMLTRFGADRGGVTVIPPPLLEDLAGAIGVWTAENDLDPDDPAVKPCLVLTCPADDDADVDAITRCLQTGNFRSRFFGEQVEAWMRLAAVSHARRAESRLLTFIGAASTQVTSGQVLGTVPDSIAALARASAIIRSSNRLPESFPMRWGVPFWLLDQMRADEARRIPGGSTGERYALAEATIRSWFSVLNITVSTFLDGETGQVFNRQGDAPMIGWPTSVVTYLYPEGTHLFLDGGTLDLGLVRDSTLNSTNDFQMFAETFEGHIMHGVESWRLVLDTCPDGSISGTIDIDPCSTGS